MKNKVTYSFINVLDGTNSPFCKLPFIQVKSANDGPSVWLTACVHGDEVGGIVVTQEVIKRLKNYLLCGTINIFPLMNPRGFETMSRKLTLSEEDLNRSFPGNPKGTLAQRIAHQIFTEITKTKPDLVLDLHNHWSYSIPHILVDKKPAKKYLKSYHDVVNLAKISGMIPVIDTDEPVGSLSNSLLAIGIRAFTIEAGESYIVNELDVERGTRAVWNILSNLEMVSKQQNIHVYPIDKIIHNKLLTYYDKPYVSKSGIIRFTISPGKIIKKNQIFARVYDVFGNELESLYAQKNALVLGHTDFASVFPGTAVMAFGIIKK